MTSKTAKKVPVTRHRLFPVIAALWVAALCGFATFAVPVSLIERVVAATGLSAVVPAAAPPLGWTARAGIAVLLTGFGAAAGLLLGRRVARSGVRGPGAAVPKVRNRDSHPDAPPRKPFIASEDMPEAAPSGRRRALSVTDETLSVIAHEAAPLPGSDQPYQPLDLDLLFAEAEDIEQPTASISVEPVSVPQPRPEPEIVEHRDYAAPTGLAPVAAAAAAPPVVAPGQRSPVAKAPLETLGVVQLVERLAFAMSEYNRRQPGGALPQLLAPAFAGIASTSNAVRVVQPAPGQVPAATGEPGPAEPYAPVAEIVAEIPDGPAEPAQERDYSSLLDVMTAARPLSLGGAARAEPAPLPTAGEYQKFVRVEQPEPALAGAEPVVIFPGQTPQPLAPAASNVPLRTVESTAPRLPAADPAETDRALRAALATLQRMSGAR